MLLYLPGAPTVRPENNVNIWNLLWLSRRLIICTEQRNIYISTFPNTLTSEWAKNHEYVFDKRVRSSMSRTAISLKFKMSCLPEKPKKTQQRQQRQRLKIEWNVYRLIWRPWLISRPKGFQTSNKLLIYYMRFNLQRQNSLSTSIRLNFVRRTSNAEHLA